MRPGMPPTPKTLVPRTRLVAAVLAAAALAPLAPAAGQCELDAFDTFDFGPGNELAGSDFFGRVVAVDADVVAVAAPYNDEPGLENVGGVYVWRWDGDDFAPEARLLPAGAGAWGLFGQLFALDGDVLVSLGDQGLVEFRRDGAAWIETTTLVPGQSFKDFDMDGDHLALGRPAGAFGSGELVLYERLPSGWEVEQVLPNPFPAQALLFGWDVSLSGDALAASAFSSVPGLDGVVFVFRRGPGGWSLEDSVTGDADEFGMPIALSGDVLAVSAPSSDEIDPGTQAAIADNGAVHVFRNDGAGHWVEEARLVPQDLGEQSWFGSTLALDGDVLAAASVHGGGNGAPAALAVFHRRDGAWHEDVHPLPEDFVASDNYGSSLAVSGEIVVAGSSSHSTGGFTAAGRAWAFDVHPVLDVGDGLAGFGGVAPGLDLADGLCPGGPFAVTLADARSSSPAWLVVGTSVLGAPFKGGTLVPSPDVVAGPFVTSAAGGLDLAFTWPAGYGGLPTAWQAAVQDADAPKGFALSNGLTITAAGL